METGETAEQPGLFETEEFTAWRQEWIDMPEYENEDIQPWRSVVIHFATREDRQAFSELIGTPLSDVTRSAWYPRQDDIKVIGVERYTDEP